MNRPSSDTGSPENPQSPPGADGQPALDPVAELVAYDEQLRGRPRSGEDGRSHAERGNEDQVSVPASELAECLQLIEEVWPRGGGLPPEPTLPARIGRFEIERVLGSGGFGIVYLARDPLLNRRVALKVPRLHALASAGLRERFRREARATAALDHPHIVPIHETGEHGPLWYIAFAYCEGPSLAQWLKLQAGDVPVRVAAAVVQHLAEAMYYSHSRGILHRDLKPSNVLLFPSPLTARNGGESLAFTPRIVDFGLARLVEDELEATGTSAVIGTPLYMAPEQALGMEPVGPAADLYALGVILYELLCRQTPFVGSMPLEVLDQVRHLEPPPIRKLRKDVPRDLETICLRCLQKRPEDRYSTARGLAEDLQRFLEKQPIVARPVSTLVRAYRWCQQPLRMREAGLTVIAVNFVVGGWTVYTAMSLAWGFVERPGNMTAADVYRYTLPVILFVAPPQILAGMWMMREKKWAVQLALGGGLAMMTMATLFSFSLLDNPFAGLWKKLPGFSMLMYSMMAMLFLLQTIVSGIAAVALRAANQGKVPRPATTR